MDLAFYLLLLMFGPRYAALIATPPLFYRYLDLYVCATRRSKVGTLTV